MKKLFICLGWGFLTYAVMFALAGTFGGSSGNELRANYSFHPAQITFFIGLGLLAIGCALEEK